MVGPHIQRWLFMPLFMVLLMALSVSCHGAREPVVFSASVVSIVDGDTLVVLRGTQQIRVRLAEIDAPERGQPWSNKSKLALGAKLFGETVSVEVRGNDRYGRSLAWITLAGREINREMVRDGHAWAYRRYLVTQNLLDAEAIAKQQRQGLWSLTNPIAPWQWRQGQRTSNTGSIAPLAPVSKTRNLKCGAKTMCREMKDCAEARFHLTRCKAKNLDGDGDGMPCERLCAPR